MIVYPAIDLKDGECVQLVQGRMDEATLYGRDPAAMARRWVGEGARWLHVVDLNGAFAGESRNLPAIRAIVEAAGVPVQVGGGIRTLETVELLLERVGVGRVILGTAALRDPALVEAAVKRYTDRVAVGIDARNGRVAVEGWAEDTDTTPLELARFMGRIGVRSLIYTDISRDGTLSGPNFEATAELIRQTGLEVILSGGMSRLSNVTRAREIGAAGCIIGTALYEGAIRLSEAVREAEAC